MQEYIMPKDGEFIVRCYEITGSSWDGTRRHWWCAAPFTGGYASNVGAVYASRAEAEAAAREMTARNTEE